VPEIAQPVQIPRSFFLGADNSSDFLALNGLEYFPRERKSVAQLVGRLNRRPEGHAFILAGPGRWGSSDLDLGVAVTYGHIDNAQAVVELAVPQRAVVPDPSWERHWSRDLYEAQVFPWWSSPSSPAIFGTAGGSSPSPTP
jgi:hypothetical protein